MGIRFICVYQETIESAAEGLHVSKLFIKKGEADAIWVARIFLVDGMGPKLVMQKKPKTKNSM